MEPKKGMILTKATFDDIGVYKCLAYNDSVEINFKIDVLGNLLIDCDFY